MNLDVNNLKWNGKDEEENNEREKGSEEEFMLLSKSCLHTLKTIAKGDL